MTGNCDLLINATGLAVFKEDEVDQNQLGGMVKIVLEIGKLTNNEK